ncbi:TetR/AcrR family transcriptional regulator [Magnetospira thiophila]
MPETKKSTCGAGAVSGAKDRILDTAIRLFCEEGIHATGIDRIIEESGVARMTLYNRFGSKRGLIRAALEREGETWRAWYEEELQRTGTTPKDRLLGVFNVLEKWFAREDFFGCAFLNAMAEHNKTDALIRELTLSHKKKVLAPIADLAQQAGYADPQGVAHQLGILMDGAIITAMVTENPAIARDTRVMAEALLAALPRDKKATAA